MGARGIGAEGDDCSAYAERVGRYGVDSKTIKKSVQSVFFRFGHSEIKNSVQVKKMELYTFIKKTVRPLFKDEDDMNYCLLNIYLTTQGARPACIPFDHSFQKNNQKVMTKIFTALESVNLIVKVGPYFDTGTAIVVANKRLFKKVVEPLLVKLDYIAEHDSKRQLNPEVHNLVGQLLGYICPNDFFKNGKHILDSKIYYDIGFMVDDILLIPMWCLKKNVDKAFAVLDKINKALKPLDKSAKLVFSKES